MLDTGDITEERAALEAAISVDPDNDDAWAAYGEYLEEIGDPRGELIMLEMAGGS